MVFSNSDMWALDPIDGTKGFLRGGQYAVCLAFLIDGEVQVGVMGCPNLPVDPKTAKPKEGESSEGTEDLGTIFVAVKGQGAFQVSRNEEDAVARRYAIWSSNSLASRL